MKERYKKTDLGLMPEEWGIVKFEDITKEHKQGYYTKNKYSEVGTYFVRITDLNNPNINYKQMPRLDVPEEIMEQYKLKENDFLFARSGTIGRYGIFKSDYPQTIFASYLIRFRFDTEKMVNGYIGYFYESEYSQKQLKAITQGSSNININADNIKSLLICVPSVKEQEKIADILSIVDLQIDDMDKLIEKTKELKNGLMQRLLIRGIGHREFKNSEVGNIPLEWEVSTLGQCGEVFGGNAFKSTKFITEQNNRCYQVIRMGNVQQCKLALDRNPVYLDENDLDVKSEKYILKFSDVLISLTGTVNKTDYGNVAWVDFDNKYLLNQRVACFRKNSNLYSNKYIYYLMQSRMFRNQFFELGVGGTGNQSNVSIGDLNNIKIYKIPIDEQIKIANILSSVDTQIEEYKNKKNKLEELKKGLMQQLLTGKIRVM